MVVVAMALAVVSLSDVVAEPSTYWLAGVKEEGWTYLGLSADHSLAIFTQAPLRPSADGRATMWVRTEQRTPDELGDRSTRKLMSFDCATAQYRTVTATTYTGLNLTGKADNIDLKSKMDVVPPGTVIEAVFNVACPTRPLK